MGSRFLAGSVRGNAMPLTYMAIEPFVVGQPPRCVPEHVPIKAIICNRADVLHCPNSVWVQGKGSCSYRSWYRAEHQRHVIYMADLGNVRAKESVANRREYTKASYMKWREANPRVKGGEDLRNYGTSSNENRVSRHEPYENDDNFD